MRVYRQVQTGGNLNITSIGSGSGLFDYFPFKIMEDVRKAAPGLVGKHVITKGYYKVDDGGGATYLVSNTKLPWSIPLGANRFANIVNKDFVNYRMLGARLQGTHADDTIAIKRTHAYADSNNTLDLNGVKAYHVWVKNNEGIIRVTEPIYCSSNVDLSGSTIIVDDVSAGWFGSYVWGQNSSEFYSYTFNKELRASMKEGSMRLEGLDGFPENTVMHLTETHYEIRDDDGYLYDVDKGELMVHTQGGIFSTALGSDWTGAGGTLIYNEKSNDFLTTDLVVQYTYLPSQHRTFIGCEVIFKGNANNYCSVLWVKGHNCTVQDFNFRPEPSVLANTAFKNAMIYVWGSYKVTIRNCNGMNASGKVTPEVHTPTSGYAIRAFQACDLVIEDCDIIGIWGSISVSSTKNCYFNRVTCNRIDVHDYIVNLFVYGCVVYSHALQIGYGSGVCLISDSTFYYQHLPEERYPTPYLFALQTGYGRIFNGKITIQNCKITFLTEDTPKELSLIWARFREDARTVERKYKFPDITIRDISIDTINPDNLKISVFNFRGVTKNNTSKTKPPISNHVAFSGDTKWDKVIETRNWIDMDYYNEGEIIRKFLRYTDSNGKTVFHSIEYYFVLSTDQMTIQGTTIRAIRDNEIVTDEAVVRRIYAPYFMTGGEYNTVINQGFVVSLGSRFFPEEVFTGNIGNKTAGAFPTHKTGVVWYGDNYGDGLFLEHVKDNITVREWRPNRTFNTGELFTVDTKVYECIKGGTTSTRLLEDSQWLEEVTWGTARVKYSGSLWVAGSWMPETGIVLVYSRPGYNGSNFTYNQYKVVQKDGRILTDNLISTSGIMLDGGITWEKTDSPSSGSWSAATEYTDNQVININNLNYKVVSNSVMNMPKRLTVSNIIHDSTVNPILFNFDSGMSVKIKGTTKIIVDAVDEFSSLSYQQRPFFGRNDNPKPLYAELETPYQDIEIVYATYNFVRGVTRWTIQNVNRSLPTINIGKLTIVNDNAFDVYYVIYESYGYGDFSWTLLKNILVPKGETHTEYVQLSGTRNDFVAQTRSLIAAIDAPKTTIKLVFTNKTNTVTPTIVCP